MRKIVLRTSVAVVGFVFAAAALTGCSSVHDVQVNTDKSNNDNQYYTNNGFSNYQGAETGASTAPYTHYAFYQKLPDGKRVLCVWAADSNSGSGGPSCDWEHVQEG